MPALSLSYLKSLPGLCRLIEVFVDFLLCFIAGIFCWSAGTGTYKCYAPDKMAWGQDYGGLSWCLFVFSTGFLIALGQSGFLAA